jgi:hypothetical protein
MCRSHEASRSHEAKHLTLFFDTVIVSEVSESNLIGGHSRLASILRSSGTIATHFQLLYRMGLVIYTTAVPCASFPPQPLYVQTP